jgi:hypothetical protein
MKAKIIPINNVLTTNFFGCTPTDLVDVKSEFFVLYKVRAFIFIELSGIEFNFAVTHTKKTTSALYY